jgi:hypothetical protein
MKYVDDICAISDSILKKRDRNIIVEKITDIDHIIFSVSSLLTFRNIFQRLPKFYLN